MSNEPASLPADLPVPIDDGAADHLVAAEVPSLALSSTQGGKSNLAAAAVGLVVVYVYPRSGRPGEPLPPGWDEIPGARGCTAQSCAFRDHARDLGALGASIIGLSAQSPAEQLEFARREHIPYQLLSDPALELAAALRLPSFEAAGMRLYRRLTFIARARRIVKVFYPVFPPQRNASDVVAWLSAHQGSADSPG
jgi:peroxiredoxin